MTWLVLVRRSVVKYTGNVDGCDGNRAVGCHPEDHVASMRIKYRFRPRSQIREIDGTVELRVRTPQNLLLLKKTLRNRR